MASKKTRKLIQKTMVGKPTHDLDVSFETNKRMQKNKKMVIIMMIMKMKKNNQPQLF
jgi:hypothetical protein